MNGDKKYIYGKVKFYDKKRKFGYITGEDGKDYFFHASNINDIDSETQSIFPDTPTFFKCGINKQGKYYATRIFLMDKE